MATCSFCSMEVKQGKGMRLFYKDGSSVFFCSKKCEANFNLKRKPSKLKWTKQGA